VSLNCVSNANTVKSISNKTFKNQNTVHIGKFNQSLDLCVNINVNFPACNENYHRNGN
jgi:hypothetical protein